MNNYRNITVNFWNDAKVDDNFTPEDKYFYLYLLTNPHTNICGCYEVSNKQIERETGYNETTIKYLINRMHVYHCVIDYSEETKEVYIYHWYKYNWSHSPKVYTAVKIFAEHIKNESFKRDMFQLIYDYFEKRKEAKEKTETETETETETVTECIDSVSIPYKAESEKCAEEPKKKEKPVKHKYGKYKNVLLTDEEFSKLSEEIPDAADMIETLSEGIEMHGYKYKSHYLAVRNWYRRDQESGKAKKTRSASWLDDYTPQEWKQ